MRHQKEDRMREFTRKQNEIINIAVHIVSEESIYKLTMKNISSNLGISEPALYRHFKNKHDILLAILEKVEDFFSFSEYSNSSSIDELSAFVSNRYEKFVTYPKISKIIVSDAIFSDNEELQSKLNNILNITRGHIRNIIKEGQDNNEIINNLPSKSICRIISGSMRLLIIQWYLSKYSFDLKDKGIELWEEIKVLIAK